MAGCIITSRELKAVESFFGGGQTGGTWLWHGTLHSGGHLLTYQLHAVAGEEADLRGRGGGGEGRCFNTIHSELGKATLEKPARVSSILKVSNPGCPRILKKS